MNRRVFLKKSAGLLLASSALTFAYTWRIEPVWPRIEEHALPIKNLPSDLVGKKLVQISDLHVGPAVDDAYLIKCFQTLSKLQPDILVITGDFKTWSDAEQTDHITQVMQELPLASLGTVGITGNHDYGPGWQSKSIADNMCKALEDLGITMLRNRSVNIEGLTIGGVNDYWGPEYGPSSVVPELKKDQANLLLVHNPDALDQPDWAGYEGWILSGHTHGGQCKPPFLPPPILPTANKRYTSGFFDLSGNRKLYINRGLGYLHRVRFNARPEITVFHLAKA